MTDDRSVAPPGSTLKWLNSWPEGATYVFNREQIQTVIDAAKLEAREALDAAAPRICPCCGLPKWPGREDFSRMSAEQINAYLAGTGNDVRVMPDAAAPDELRAALERLDAIARCHPLSLYGEAELDAALDDSYWLLHPEQTRSGVDVRNREAIEARRAALRPAGAPEPGE